MVYELETEHKIIHGFIISLSVKFSSKKLTNLCNLFPPSFILILITHVKS